MAAVPQSLRLREIKPGDKTTGLSLGTTDAVPLKTFLKKCALDFHRANIAKTYVLVPSASPNPQIYAYITLMNSEIAIEGAHCLDDCITANSYKTFPAVKIARLAVDKTIQFNGFGTAIVSWAISLTKEKIMPHVGCRFLITDSKKSAVDFYKKSGFRILDTEENVNSEHPVMFLDINKL